MGNLLEACKNYKIVSILDPNASIEPGFTAYTAQLSTGEELFGIIASETANSLIFKQSTGQTRTLLRSEIRSLRSGDISLMPEEILSIEPLLING